jgi:hypothetical protein
MNTETFTESNIIIKTLGNLYNSLFGSTNEIQAPSRNELLTNELYNETEHVPVHVPSRNDLLATEAFENFMQNGGRNNIVKGIRPLNNLNELSESNSMNSVSEQSEMYGGKENRQSPADLFHQETIDYLKDDLKLSPLEARAYKSLAYRHIKEKHPDASGLERAKLMLALVKSDNFMNDFESKLDNVMKIIEEKDKEREKRLSEKSEGDLVEKIIEKSEDKPTKARKSSVKSKSSRRSRQHGGGMSETSIDDMQNMNNINQPYYKEYREIKDKYLQAKLQQNGGEI